MKIVSLRLVNFRNYSEQSVTFADGLNIFYGKNASGKTNLLESVYLCSVLRSPRTSRDKELIMLGAERALVSVVVEKKYRKHRIDIQIDAVGKKKVAIDGIPVQRAGELLGVAAAVFFSPDEMKLVKESPQERRVFLDVGLSQQQKSYFIALQRYNKVLKQKNNQLKNSRYQNNINDMLEVWDAALAEHGAIIIKKRMDYISDLDAVSAEAHSVLSEGSENLELTYESAVALEGDIRANLLDALAECRERDKELGYSTVGPHRDDIKISLDGRDSRKFASQGQQRTIALALKLGEVELYKKETGEAPILLLDDVLSELDENRRRLLLEKTSGIQTLLTCTEFDGEAGGRFRVENGRLSNG